MYEFLSDEWMEAAREIRARYESELPAIEMSVRVNQVITDVPFGEGTIQAYVDTSEGSLALELGELEEPDAVMMVDYRTAHALIVERDPSIVMQSFLEGRIKVQGDMMKLMAMQAAAAAAPDEELALQMADELREITIPPEPRADDEPTESEPVEDD
jgi:putative sterol carrier protein